MSTLPTPGGVSAARHSTDVPCPDPSVTASTRLRRLTGTAVVTLSLLVLSACGQPSEHGDAHGSTTSSAPVAGAAPAGSSPEVSPSSVAADASPDASPDADPAAHNEADISFAQGMIVHHRGALEMSALAADRAGSDAVRQLADRIEAAQTPEIDLMTGWLQAWSAPVPTGMAMPADTSASAAAGTSSMGHDMSGHDMAGGDAAGHDAMGMMSDADMAALAAASGADFDRRFLELMIVHHEGAVAMSQTELTDGQSTEALALSRAIIDSQTAEIAEMRGLLASA